MWWSYLYCEYSSLGLYGAICGVFLLGLCSGQGLRRRLVEHGGGLYRVI